MSHSETNGLSAEVLDSAYLRAFGLLHMFKFVWLSAQEIVTDRSSPRKCALLLAFSRRWVRSGLYRGPQFNMVLRSAWVGGSAYEHFGVHAATAHEWTLEFARQLLMKMDRAALRALVDGGHLDAATIQKMGGMSEIVKRGRGFVLAYRRPWRRTDVLRAIAESVYPLTGLRLDAVDAALQVEHTRALEVTSEGLTVSEAARIAGVDDGAISTAANRGEIKDNGRTGRERRLDLKSFRAWKASRRKAQR